MSHIADKPRDASERFPSPEFAPKVLVRDTSWNDAKFVRVEPSVATIRVLDYLKGDWRAQFEGMDAFLFMEDPSGQIQMYGPDAERFHDILRYAVKSNAVVFYLGCYVDNSAALKSMLPDLAPHIYCLASGTGFEESINKISSTLKSRAHHQELGTLPPVDV